jgi:hypothetical protein
LGEGFPPGFTLLQLNVPEFAARVFAADPTVPGGLTIAASVAPGDDSGSTIVVNSGAACFWLHGSMDLLTLPPLVNARVRAALERL